MSDTRHIKDEDYIWVGIDDPVQRVPFMKDLDLHQGIIRNFGDRKYQLYKREWRKVDDSLMPEVNPLPKGSVTEEQLLNIAVSAVTLGL